MRRLALFTYVVAFLGLSGMGWAQESSSTQTTPPETAQGLSTANADSVSPEIAKAEAAMAKSDWKTAEPLLDSWLATHSTDARALFDAGYVADAQGRNDDAVALYRKAADANPKSFEAQISLGGTQGKGTRMAGAGAD